MQRYIKKFKLNLSFTAPQELIKCMPSFDRALCSAVEGVIGDRTPAGCCAVNSAACMARTSLGFTRLWHVLFLLALFSWGKTAPNLRQKLCEQKAFHFSLKRESLHCTHAKAPASVSPPLPLATSHLWIRGQPSLSAHPFSFSATQLNVKCPVATPSFQPWGKPCWNPRESCCYPVAPHSWDWNSPIS